MGDKTGIEWTDATWNPVVGCSKVSAGCDHCYAISQAARIQRMGGKGGEAYAGTTLEDGSDWTGMVRCLPERLEQPLKWRRPRRIFVNSMSDLFHPDVPGDFIEQVWDVMYRAYWHQFQILTKRPKRMALELSRVLYDCTYQIDYPPPNVWLGTSIESDKYTFRANHLRATPAAVKFLSLEPLLGPLPSLDLAGIDWVIVGGESGPGARPMHPAWVRELRDRCLAAGVAFFFKQWGAWVSDSQGGSGVVAPSKTMGLHRDPEHNQANTIVWVDSDGCHAWVNRVGKSKAGRELDGRTWDEMPELAVPV